MYLRCGTLQKKRAAPASDPGDGRRPGQGGAGADSDLPGLVQYVVILICNLTNHETPWKDFKQGSVMVRHVFLKMPVAAGRQTRGAEHGRRRREGPRRRSSLSLGMVAAEMLRDVTLISQNSWRGNWGLKSKSANSRT